MAAAVRDGIQFTCIVIDVVSGLARCDDTDAIVAGARGCVTSGITVCAVISAVFARIAARLLLIEADVVLAAGEFACAVLAAFVIAA